MKLRFFLAFAVCSCTAFPQAASGPPAAAATAPSTPPDPAKVPIIESLFRLTKPDAMVQQMLAQYKNAFGNAARNGFTNEVTKMGQDPAKYQPDFQKLQDQIFGLMSSRLDWQKLKPQFVKVYSDTFSKEELSGILAFYESPAGKAEIAKMPGLLAKCSTIGQQQMAGAGPEMQKMMNDFMEGIKQKSQKH